MHLPCGYVDARARTECFLLNRIIFRVTNRKVAGKNQMCGETIVFMRWVMSVSERRTQLAAVNGGAEVGATTCWEDLRGAHATETWLSKLRCRDRRCLRDIDPCVLRDGCYRGIQRKGRYSRSIGPCVNSRKPPRTYLLLSVLPGKRRRHDGTRGMPVVMTRKPMGMCVVEVRDSLRPIPSSGAAAPLL